MTARADLLGLTGEQALGRKQGGVRREFPGEFLEMRFEEIEQLAKEGNARAMKAKKLLMDSRWDKEDL